MSISIEESLTSNQEEADTKVVSHRQQILKSNETSVITLRSPSGDTDIVALTVTLLYEFQNIVLIDDGSGDNGKVMQLSNIDNEKHLVYALIGFHAFTGNDHISSFFRKGKEKCWKLLEKTNKFQNPFSVLAENWEVSNNLFIMLEGFVCQLYGYQTFVVLSEFAFKFMTRSIPNKIKQLIWLHFLLAVQFYDYISPDLTW